MTKFRMFSGTERRGEVRSPCDDRARILASGAWHNCVVIDLSTHGARFNTGTSFPLPLRFEVEFSKTGKRRSVQLVWQNGSEAGVQFR